MKYQSNIKYLIHQCKKKEEWLEKLIKKCTFVISLLCVSVCVCMIIYINCMLKYIIYTQVE